MFRDILCAVVLVLSSLGATSWGQIAGDGTAVNGLLLLKNGETLAGDITRSGDYYIVAGRDSEINIRLTDTEAVCRDLDDAYRHKAATLPGHGADDHATLADWCIQNKLFGHAARELTQAYRIDDTHPRLTLLERRLKAEMSDPKPPPEAPPAAPPPAVGDDELERTARSISPELLHEFTVRVQPLLVNYCATAGCHGPKPSSDFHLHRIYLNERNDLRLARMNLHSVLQQMNKRQPAQSPLLTKPLAVHGGAEKPQFDAHNAEHYRQLAGWVMRSAGAAVAPPVADTAATTPATGALMQRLPLEPPASAAAPPTPPVAAPPAPAGPKPPEPIDPFDPAQFNQPRE